MQPVILPDNVIICIARISQMSNALKIRSYIVKYLMISKDKMIIKNSFIRIFLINKCIYNFEM